MSAKTGSATASQGSGKFEDTWEMLDDLGTGTYATVKRARNRKTGEEVAVKIMVKDYVDDLDSLRGEVDVLKKVGNVPHVVHLRDSFETKRHLYFVMELCQGGELFEKLVQVGVFSERTVAHHMKQILEALAACHASNIVHRDLKPENLLLASPTPDAELKVCDFGVSKVLGSKGERLSDIAGSPMYIAPEIVTKQRGGYSFPADCWSAGVIMFVLLGGYPPFDGETDEAIMDAVANGSLEEAMKGRDCWDMVSDEAKDLLDKLLTKDPKQRITAADALKHPWVVSGGPEHSEPLLRAVDSLKNYHAQNGIKKAALQFMASQISGDQLDKMKAIFEHLDQDGDGHVNVSELHNALGQTGVNAPSELLNMLVQDASSTHSKRGINWKDFVACTMSRRHYLQSERLHAAFKALDADNSGYLDVKEIAQALKCSLEEAKAAISEADTDADGRVDYEEFLVIMGKRDVGSAQAGATATSGADTAPATGAGSGAGAGAGGGAGAKGGSRGTRTQQTSANSNGEKPAATRRQRGVKRRKPAADDSKDASPPRTRSTRRRTSARAK